MSKVLKGLAIAVLLVTVIGAGVVLYGLTMFEPQVESVQITATPAVQAQNVFASLMEQAALGTFSGRLFGETEGLRAEACTFLTYTVRLKNRGFFPAEWISLHVEPLQSADGAGRDVLQLGDTGAYVLAQGSTGDMQATILREGDAGEQRRMLKVICYVFGQKTEVTVQAE